MKAIPGRVHWSASHFWHKGRLISPLCCPPLLDLVKAFIIGKCPSIDAQDRIILTECWCWFDKQPDFTVQGSCLFVNCRKHSYGLQGIRESEQQSVFATETIKAAHRGLGSNFDGERLIPDVQKDA